MSTFTPKKQPVQPVKYNFSANAEDKKVLGFSGKLGSGKTTGRNYLLSMAMTYSLGLVKYAYINELGKIVVPTVDDKETIFDVDSRDVDISSALQANLWPYMRQFSCAAPLKEFLFNTLGVPASSLWGTQEEKLVPIEHLRWENMPVKVLLPPQEEIINKKKHIVSTTKTGAMTGRDIMEYFGTEIVRKMYPTAWSNALAKMITNYGSLHSIVDDIRFVDEVEALRGIGGKVIRLTLTTEESSKNTHDSNCSLDSYTDFDAVIDNQNLTIEQTFVELIRELHGFGWFKVVS